MSIPHAEPDRILHPGCRIRPKRGRRLGTVVARLQPTHTGRGVVAIRWDSTPGASEAHDATALILVEPAPEPPARTLANRSTRELIETLMTVWRRGPAPNLMPGRGSSYDKARTELQRREIAGVAS